MAHGEGLRAGRGCGSRHWPPPAAVRASGCRPPRPLAPAGGPRRTRPASSGRLPAAARASRGSGGPRPSIFRLRSWRPSRAATTTFSSGSSRALIRSGTTSRSPVRASAQAATCADAGVAIGEHLAEPVLEGPQHVGPFALIAFDQPGDRRVGVLGPRDPRARPASPPRRRSWAGS